MTKPPTKKPTTDEETIELAAVVKLDRLVRDIIEVPITGISPLIPHRWSEKSLRALRDKQSATTTAKQVAPKIPEEEAEAALYRLPDGRPAMPATAFKAATVAGARYYWDCPDCAGAGLRYDPDHDGAIPCTHDHTEH